MNRFRKSSVAAVAALAGLLLVPVAALAHAHPTKMNPAPNSVVAAPAQLEITFSEAVEPKLSVLEVLDGMGRKENKGVPQAVAGDDKTLTLALPTLAAGAYTVHWVSVATDGHRLEGKYSFTVK